MADRFLLTQYNLPIPSRDPTGRAHIDDGWLTARLALFDRYCVPSVAAQGDGWRWLIFVAADTPDEHRQRIESAARRCPWAELVTGRSVADAVRERATAPLIVTARLDNDDAIGNGYLAACAVALTEPGTAVVFDNGYQLHPDGTLVTRHTHRGPFVAVAEPADTVRTVIAFKHRDVDQHFTVTTDTTPGRYLQVVHGGNISNRRHAGTLVDPAAVVAQFGLQPGALGERPPGFWWRRPLSIAANRARAMRR